VPRAPALPLVLALALLAGCYARDAYTIDAATLRQVAALSPADRARAVVPARREADGRAVDLRARAIPAAALDPTTATAVHISTDEPNPMVTTGSILTWVGTALSIVGTLGFLTANGDAKWVFGAIELLGEPAMLAGCVLWPLGLTRPPQEVRK
jgi:hypothetical protein